MHPDTCTSYMCVSRLCGVKESCCKALRPLHTKHTRLKTHARVGRLACDASRHRNIIQMQIKTNAKHPCTYQNVRMRESQCNAFRHMQIKTSTPHTHAYQDLRAYREVVQRPRIRLLQIRLLSLRWCACVFACVDVTCRCVSTDT